MIRLVRRKTALTLLAVLTVALIGSATVCRKVGLSGFEESQLRAERVLPPNTSDPTAAAVYIENTPEGLYYQSNFITPGYDFEYPTKIGREKINDVREAFLNIRFAEVPTYDEQLAATTIYRDNVRIFLDESVFSQGGYPIVDVGDATNITVVDRKAGVSLPDGSVERLDRSSPPPILLSKVFGCCLYGIPPHLAPGYQEILEQRAFRRDDVRFISLVRDSGTDAAIESSPNIKSRRIGESGAPTQSLAQIESAFQAARGKTVVLLSHVERDNFVVRDPSGEITSSIPISAVRELAAQYRIDLVDLGCQTAQQVNKDSLGFGVITEFNTVLAVSAVENALATSNNYADFLEAMSSEKLKIVVDEGFVRGWPLCADVYSQAKQYSFPRLTRRRPRWVKLARIFVSFRKT